MKRPFLLLIVLLSSLSVLAQERLTIRCHIVDASSGEALPYVAVYVSPQNTTIANHDGDFTILAKPQESIRLSYVGYETVTFKASEIPQTVKMQMMDHTLHQLTVMPTDAILMKVKDQLNKDYRKSGKKKSQYFVRLNSTIGEKEELMEAFLEARSAVNLRDLALQSGRRGQLTKWGMLRPQLSDVNLQHALELGVMIMDQPFWGRHILPVPATASEKYFRKHYDIQCEVMGDGTPEKTYCLDMQKKADSKEQGLLVGRLYVNAATYQPLRFEGEVTDMYLEVTRNKTRITRPVRMKVNIIYRHTGGYSEIDDISCEIGEGDLHTQTILHNVSNLDIKFGKAKAVRENMLSAMDAAGFDATLWEHAGIVQRTEYEERLARQQTEIDSTAVTQHTGNEQMDALVDRLRLFGQRIPQEKVFLHLDNTCYFLGDTIWYAAYTRRTNDDLPSDISNVLYVELLNHDGYVMERKILQMKDGRGHGNFWLDPEYYSGFYELRAYTRWQLNWGSFEHKHGETASQWFNSEEREKTFYRDYDKLYSRVVPVYDAPTDSTQFYHDMTLRPLRRYFKKEPDKREASLKFFPEGGNLVQGLPCRVAFEAAWDDGDWLDGELTTDEGKTFPTVHRGRGTFTFTPTDEMARGERMVTFKSKDGKQQLKARLPKAEKTGASLTVEEEDGQWVFRVSLTPDLHPDSLALTVMHEGVLSEVKTMRNGKQGVNNDPNAAGNNSLFSAQPEGMLSERSGERTFSFQFPKGSLPTGVNQVTLFDNQGRVWADRLFFVNDGQDLATPSVTIKGMKDEYRPFEKINLDIQAADDKGGAEYISLSVRDAMNQDYLYDTGNMLTEMLLASEVKGFIPQPEWYFEQDDSLHREALDLLMMVQGWRRFTWREMAVPGEWDLVHPDEKNIVVEGVVGRYMSQRYLNEYLSSANVGVAEGDEVARPQNDRQWAELRDQLGGSDKIKRELRLHAEIVDLTTMKAVASEMDTQNGRFRIKLPNFYDEAIFFLSAADTTKWKKGTNSQNYAWVQGAHSYEDMPADASLRYKMDMAMEDPDFLPYISQPYPRFVKPYTWHQHNLAPPPHRERTLFTKRFSDGTVQLNEVAVTARRNGQRRFSDSEPAFMVDAYEAYNNALDAGLSTNIDGLVHAYVGDYGMEDPRKHVSKPDGNGGIKTELTSGIELRYGPNVETRFDHTTTNEDSLYLRSQLWSKGLAFEDMIPGQLKYYHKLDDHWQPTEELDIAKLDKFVIYTDYSPRLEGSRRYMGSDLPDTYIVAYPYHDDGRRAFYRDRRYMLPGFSLCEEFYNPDYSQQALPQGRQDRRRTLYWNPSLKLDQDGHASVTLFNCERTTQLNVTAEGLTSKGEILTGRQE